MKDKKTLFAVKLKTGQTTRELVFLGLILGGMALAGVLFCALQWRICHGEHPSWSVLQCMRRFE